MADEVIVLDAAGSNPDGSNPGSPLSIGPGTSYPITEASFPAPPLNVQYASSADTEGEVPVSRRYGNRTLTIRIEMDESSATNTLLDALQMKVAKLQREGGTVSRTRKDGSTIRIYDIFAADGFDWSYDQTYILAHSTGVTLSLPARPLARGAEQDLGDNVETTLPCLIFTEASVPGDVEALGRLVIDNDVAADQQWLVWGLQSRYYDAAVTAGLFYEAEGRTAMSGSSVVTGPTGASGGASNNVMRNTALTTSFQAVLSTQATGGGAHLSHVGVFRVFARVQLPTTNGGAVSVALEWGEGDFRRFQQNPQASLDTTWEGTWRVLDLGLVSLSKVTAGTQRWEARVLAKSTNAGDDIDVDWLMLVPVDEGSGAVYAVNRQPSSTGFSARDEFDQTAGALTGKTLPIGGTWAGAGSATDFTVETTSPGSGGRANALHRSVGGEPISSGSGRFALAGTSTFTNITVSVDHMTSSGDTTGLSGVFARYTDTNNWITCGYQGVGVLRVYKRVAGTVTSIASALTSNGAEMNQTPVPGGFVFTVYANGLWNVTNRAGGIIRTGYDADLATGGPLATGRIGIYDGRGSAGSALRSLDNFWAAVPPADAALFGSQSLELRHNAIRREDTGGTLWVEPSAYIGDYLRVPVSGQEGRTTRVIIKASRFAPGDGPDASADDISARLFVTPRYLT